MLVTYESRAKCAVLYSLFEAVIERLYRHIKHLLPRRPYISHGLLCVLVARPYLVKVILHLGDLFLKLFGRK